MTTDRSPGAAGLAEFVDAPWAYEVRTLAGLLVVLEDVLAIYAELYGEPFTRELFGLALGEAELAKGGLQAVALCAELRAEEGTGNDLVGGLQSR